MRYNPLSSMRKAQADRASNSRMMKYFNLLMVFILPGVSTNTYSSFALGSKTLPSLTSLIPSFDYQNISHFFIILSQILRILLPSTLSILSPICLSLAYMYSYLALNCVCRSSVYFWYSFSLNSISSLICSTVIDLKAMFHCLFFFTSSSLSAYKLYLFQKLLQSTGLCLINPLLYLAHSALLIWLQAPQFRLPFPAFSSFRLPSSPISSSSLNLFQSQSFLRLAWLSTLQASLISLNLASAPLLRSGWYSLARRQNFCLISCSEASSLTPRIQQQSLRKSMNFYQERQQQQQ